MIPGGYFDGRTARRHAVMLAPGPDGVAVEGDGVARRAAWDEVSVSERSRHGPRVIEFGDGARCEIDDAAAFDAARRRYRPGESPVVRLQQSWAATAAAVAAFVALSAAGYFLGLPWLADRASRHVPPAVVEDLSRRALESLEHMGLEPSTLPPERQAALARAWQAMQPAGAPATRLRLRAGGSLGANALALPSGDIVVTDELVALADGEDELLLAVFAHEQGHVAHRHGIRNVLQSTVVGTLAGWYLGDVSSVLAGAAAAGLSLRYSRGFEQEADDYAAAFLRARGRSPALLATMLERLEASRADGTKGTTEAEGADGNGKNGSGDAAIDLFDSHPATARRVQRLREQ